MLLKKIMSAVLAGAILISAACALAAQVNAITSSGDFISAFSKGGNYELSGDISMANAGITTQTTTGTVDGKGHTLTKSNASLNDAILYQNGNADWTFKDMIIDGNKSALTFTDAALWYMAGTVRFENVTIRNFKTLNAARYALNCNSAANMTLDSVKFTGNENINAQIASSDIYIDGGILHLAGSTKANVYYAGGSIDVSGLKKDCEINITASSAELYARLKRLLPSSPSVRMTADDIGKSVSYAASGIKWSLAGSRTDVGDGSLSVSVTASSYIDEPKDVRIYAAAYNSKGVLLSVGTRPVSIAASSSETVDVVLNASSDSVVYAYLWDGTAMEPFAEKLLIDKVADKNLILSYDFEDPGETASMLMGGASVAGGGGISGNGLAFDGVNGYMLLPNGILTENMTVTGWLKTDEVQGWARFFDFGSSDSQNFFYSPSGGRVESRSSRGTDTMDTAAFSNAGIWEHYAVTRSADRVQLYRNGELVKEAACAYSVTAVTEATNYIGRSHYAGDKYFSGVMDEIRIYDKILTAGEIKAMYDEYSESISAAAAYKDYAELNLASELSDGEQLRLSGANGSDITWTASYKSAIDNNGMIKASPAGGEDKRVTLTAKIKNGSSEYTKSFKVTILAAPSLTGFSDYGMDDVTMHDAYLVNGREKMYDYLKDFDIDKCVSGFRRTAGLSSVSDTYGGWETSLIAGHAIGHYTTALAQAYSDTGDTEMLAKSQELIDKLYEAQIKDDTTVNGQSIKRGYLFATTNAWPGGRVVAGETQFDNVEANKTNITNQAWVPWYTMHKILAGLVDTYKLTGNEKALEMAKELGTWVYNRVGGYTAAKQERVLNIEYGGMNDVLYELYKITKDPNHAKAAHIFDEVSLFDEIYNGNDVLANKHANTTIPKILGALGRVRAIDAVPALITDAPDDVRDREYYLKVAENFWDIVVNDHSYVTGGNSENEHFRAPHTENAFRNEINCETCNTYNMLKLSRELYKLTGKKKYEDYYEGTFLNAIVSSQNPETGMTMYFQPMATGYYKVFSSRWNDFWCCTGSGMESFTKLTDSIYYKNDGKIAVNQYISSALTDDDNNIKLTQNSALPEGDTSEIAIEPITGETQTASIILRIPEWCAAAPIIKLNDSEYDYTQSAGYAEIEREWRAGDKLEITMPMELRAYGLYDSPSAIAFKYGPTVLSVGLGKSPALADTMHGMAVRKPKAKANVNEYVIINSDYGTREEWLANLNENMVKTEGKLEFTMKNTDQPLVFTPHYKRYDERYGIYWYVTGMTEEEQAAQILADKQAGRDENIIIDSIEPSHDQQENGHGYAQENSIGVEGVGDMVNYRLISNGGYVDYQMAVKKDAKNYLAVTYHASDAGKRMNIYAGSTKIAEVTASGRNETVRYEIPAEAVVAAEPASADTIKGRDALHIVFRADAGTDAPKLCGKVQILTDYSENANLASLSFDKGALSPDFDAETEEYTLTVPSGEKKVKLTSVPADKYGLVYVNDLLINDAAPKEITIAGAPLVIKVYAEDHQTFKTYIINFNNQ